MQSRYLDSIGYQKIVENVSNQMNKKYPYVHSRVPLLECLELIMVEMENCKYCRKYTAEKKRGIFVNLFDDVTTMLTDATLRFSFEQYSEYCLIAPMYDLLRPPKMPKPRRRCCS